MNVHFLFCLCSSDMVLIIVISPLNVLIQMIENYKCICADMMETTYLLRIEFDHSGSSYSL